MNSISECGEIAAELGETEGKIDQIVQSLSKPLRYDLRTNFDKPLFKTSVTSMADLRIGQTLTGKFEISNISSFILTVLLITLPICVGRINNVTDFGAFVDIGIGKDALVHKSAMQCGIENLTVTMNVTVRVKSIDTSLERVGLELVTQ